MERRDSPQESPGLCCRLFRLIMNSLAFQSLKRIALRYPGDQYVPISTLPQNKDHSVADGSFSSGKNLIEVQKDGKFGNENSTLIAVEAANGHKAIIRKNRGSDDRERLNGKVIDTNTIPIKFPGMVDKRAPTEGWGATAAATTSKVTQEGDANIVPVIMNIGDKSKRVDGKNTAYLTIDEKANGHKAIIRKNRVSDDRERLNGKVIDTNTIPIKFPGMVDKGAPTEGWGATAAATTSKVTQEGDANIVPVIMNIGDKSKRDDGKNTAYLTIDERAEQFIKMRRPSHSRGHSPNESKSGGPQKKKPHP